MDVRTAAHQTAQSVQAVLAGVPLHEAAARIAVEPADLADAVVVYQAAGLAALETQAAARSWYQVRIQFTDWNHAEYIGATRLGPQLEQAQDTGVFAAWWFIRKAPCWRLRARLGPAATLADMEAAIGVVLDNLTDAGLIDQWWKTVYEPEIWAFGGQHSMNIAHDLFHADSRGILHYLRRHDPTTPESTLGRRELSVLLCSALFRSAGQEWYERGDVWHRVAQMRPLSSDTPIDRFPDLAGGLRRLMTLDTSLDGTLFGTDGPLTFAAPWVAAFHQAGRSLGDAARDGTLQRGVRDILAHHVIFHWNRFGLASQTQAILARAARDTVMDPPHTSRSANVGET